MQKSDDFVYRSIIFMKDSICLLSSSNKYSIKKISYKNWVAKYSIDGRFSNKDYDSEYDFDCTVLNQAFGNIHKKNKEKKFTIELLPYKNEVDFITGIKFNNQKQTKKFIVNDNRLHDIIDEYIHLILLSLHPSNPQNSYLITILEKNKYFRNENSNNIDPKNTQQVMYYQENIYKNKNIFRFINYMNKNQGGNIRLFKFN